MTAPTAVIAGGGLAGLAAAVRLARQGARPIILEKRPFVGGRAFSFTDPETGVEVDNGQHVFLGACDEYIAFLKEIGAWERVHMARGLDTPVLRHGVIRRLKPASLPGGVGMLAALLRYGHLSKLDRLRAVYGLLRIRTARPTDGRLERESFESWLRRHGQTDGALSGLWNLVVLPALNDDVSEVSAAAGIMLFQTALLGPGAASAIGYSRVGLTSLVAGAARRRLAEAGGEVRTGVEVTGLDMRGEAVAAVRTADGSLIPGDAHVLALPFQALPAVLPPALAEHESLAAAAGLDAAPIVGIHIWYDRPVLEEEFLAVLDSPVQWVFNVSRMHGDQAVGIEDSREHGQHVAVSLSGAWQWRDRPKGELRKIFVSEMARLFPAAAAAAITRTLVVKQLDATFRSKPGSAAHRLPQRTPVPNLFLAGDWTQTGWPSTMEGAVRSGNLAAEAALAALGLPAPGRRKEDFGGASRL